MLLCECVSDWPLKTRNIVLHVSATPIGYLGPALHQAAVLDGNVIVINTGKFKNRRTCFAAPLRHFLQVQGSFFGFLDGAGGNVTSFHWRGCTRFDRLNIGSRKCHYWLLESGRHTCN